MRCCFGAIAAGCFALEMELRVGLGWIGLGIVDWTWIRGACRDELDGDDSQLFFGGTSAQWVAA